MTTPGKYHHLRRCSTRAGHFVVLAIDHRANLLQVLNQAAPITEAEFTTFKQTIIQTLADEVSAVLTDPAFGIGAGIANRSFRAGLLAPIEVTDYDLHPDQRQIEFIPHWSVHKIKRIGADGVKLLLPYHPEAASASERETIVRQLVDQCAEYDIPFFLEPITYSLDPNKPLDNSELRQITVEMARRFSSMGVDVLKLLFPVDPTQSSSEAEWLSACQEVTAACGAVPWTLLSAGVTYEMFLKQAHTACAAGASGVIVGRAIWNDAVALQGETRTHFIQTTMVERMRTLAALCADYGTPWFERVTAPDTSPTWYEAYD